MNQTGGEEAIVLGAIIIAGIVALLVVLAINAVICWLLSGVLKQVPAEHRKMEPGMVWLLMIPCFSLIWNFFVFQRVPDSLKSYFDSIGKTDVGDCCKQLGLLYAIAGACSLVPFLNYLAGPASLVLLIIVLVKLMDLKKSLPA